MTDETPEEPSLVDFDQAALERWFGIPDQQSIAISVTRADMDNLFVGLRNIGFSSLDTTLAVDHLNAGRSAECQEKLLEAGGKFQNGINLLTHFMVAVMQKAEPLDD